jgi:class 3 adenylate cyclase
MIFYGIISFLIGFHHGVWIQIWLVCLFAVAFILLKQRVALDLVGNYIPAIGFIGVVSLCFYSGGLDSPVLPWISLVPIVSLLFTHQRWAIGWLIFILAFILIYRIYLMPLIQVEIDYNNRYKDFFYLSSLFGLISTYLLFNLIYKRSIIQINEVLESKNLEIELQNTALQDQSRHIKTHLEQIEVEKAKSDELLKNILPENIAESLKVNGKTEAKLYENVSILFTDFVGFTKYCETISPQKLISILHQYFQAFDDITEKYGLEKIKTIGDAYMAVSGLPDSSPDHAVNAVKAAIEMRHFVENYNANAGKSEQEHHSSPTFQVRIGIHSGTVIAGIIGNKKFAFDIWGDAVNIAARIQQIGAPQKVSMSQTTYSLVKDLFPCEYQGKINAKNKGDLDLYTIR